MVQRGFKTSVQPENDFLLKNHQGKLTLVKERWTLFLKLIYSKLSVFLLQYLEKSRREQAKVI